MTTLNVNEDKMKCNKKILEAYLDNELDLENQLLLQEHITGCSACRDELLSLQSINSCLDVYEFKSGDATFFSDLYKIQFDAKKRFGLFNLFPRELAFSAILIFFALYIGIYFSLKTIDLNNIDLYYRIDYFEDISLISLLDF